MNTILTSRGEFRPPTYTFCDEKSSYSVDVSTEVTQHAMSNDIVSVYPNPAREVVTIELLDKESDDASLAIWDIAGKQVVAVKAFREKYIEYFPEGIYFYSVQLPDGTVHSGKIVRQ